MTLFPAPRASASNTSHSAAHQAAPWIRGLARLGYAAKGVVYLIIGGLAVHAALTPVERPEGSEGALLAVLHQPFGRVLLGIIAVGLAGYVLWRIVQALLDPGDKGTDAKGLATRAGYLISGSLYAAVAFEAMRLLVGSDARAGREQRAEHWTAIVMSQPLGRWIIGAVGIGIILFGLYEFYRAATMDLRKRMDLTSLGGATRTHVIRFGRFGLAARGVVFLIMGSFLIRAALQYNPGKALGLAGALRTLQGQPYGPYLLGAVALGLSAYGAYQVAKARYRVIHAP